METFQLSGGCLCGKVRYTQIGHAKSVEHCHCSMCRKAHGALFASAAVLDADQLQIDSGGDHIAAFESSAGNWRRFCQSCGCQLFMTVDIIPNEIYLWVASLDEGAHPGHPTDKEVHIFVGSKAPWENVEKSHPHFAELPDNIGIGKN